MSGGKVLVFLPALAFVSAESFSYFFGKTFVTASKYYEMANDFFGKIKYLSFIADRQTDVLAEKAVLRIFIKLSKQSKGFKDAYVARKNQTQLQCNMI